MGLITNPAGSSTKYTYVTSTGKQYPTNNPGYVPASEGGQRMTQAEFEALSPQARSAVLDQAAKGTVPYSQQPAPQPQQPAPPTASPYRTSVVFKQNQNLGTTPQETLKVSNEQAKTTIAPQPTTPTSLYSPFFSKEGQKQRLTNVVDTFKVMPILAVEGIKNIPKEFNKPQTTKQRLTDLVLGPASAAPKIVRSFKSIPVSPEYEGTILEKAAVITNPAVAAGVVVGLANAPAIFGAAKAAGSTAAATPVGQAIGNIVGTVAKTPAGQAIGTIQTAAGKNWLLGTGLGIAEGEAILQTSRGVSKLTAPADQKAILKTQDFKVAMQEFNRAREAEIAKKPIFVQGVYYVPGLGSMTDKKAQDAAIKAGTDYLVNKGYNKAAAEAAIKRQSKASDYGEIIGQLNVGRLSEKYGEVQVGAALNKLRTTEDKFLIQTAKRAAVPLFKAGALEGTAQTFNMGQSRYNTQKWITDSTTKPLEVLNPLSKNDVGRIGNIARGAIYGGASATVLGLPVISLKAKYPTYSKLSEIIGYSTDPTEWPSDQLFNAEKAVSKAIGKPFTGPAYSVKGKSITFNSGTGFKVNIPTLVNIPSMVDVPQATKTNTPINILTNINVPTNIDINVPSNVDVPIDIPIPVDIPVDIPTTINTPVDVPVPVPIPIDIPIDIPVTITTPVFKLPAPLLPFLGGDMGSSGPGGRGRRENRRYLNELVAGQNFFNAMVGVGDIGQLFKTIKPKKIKKSRRVSKTINKLGTNNFSMPSFTMPKIRGF